jgi:anti-sigma B factor antagonist
MALSESSSVSVSRRGVVAPGGCDVDRGVVWLRGEHDISTVAFLAETMARAIAVDDAELVVDLSGVQFMDAATIGVLIRARGSLRLRSRSLRLRSASRSARYVFELCGLAGLLDTRPVDATGTVGALGTWVAVPAADRVDRRADRSAPTSRSANEQVDAGGVAARTTMSSADADRPADELIGNVAGRRGP